MAKGGVELAAMAVVGAPAVAWEALVVMVGAIGKAL